MKKIIFLLLAIIMISAKQPVATITSIKIGNWENATTWNCNCVPTGADIAIIAHDSVTISTHVFIHEVRSNIGGKIHFKSTAWLEFK